MATDFEHRSFAQELLFMSEILLKILDGLQIMGNIFLMKVQRFNGITVGNHHQ